MWECMRMQRTENARKLVFIMKPDNSIYRPSNRQDHLSNIQTDSNIQTEMIVCLIVPMAVSVSFGS